ncbi:MAG TPA: phosphoadenylyl-sulfate reductase [Candidatus Dormibacteraeota bacterium]|nr:phosphoadenylyl-sulfate reductase [Candidatus Dormibacteraeota bacterium]
MSAMALPESMPDLEGRRPEEIVAWAYQTYGRVAIVASFQAESSVLIHMASQVVERPEVVTLDTGRLPDETFDVIDRIQRRYAIRLHVQAPAPDELAELVARDGPNLFRESVELRHRCCEIRKVRPLTRALAGFDAWVTGVRRDQSASRHHTPLVQADRAHGGIAKVSPLAGWSRDQVWAYIREHDLDYHELYDRGYASIGCAPCTRAVESGEDERAGRWWWEQSAVKECGLHWTEHGLVRAASLPSGGGGSGWVRS